MKNSLRLGFALAAAVLSPSTLSADTVSAMGRVLPATGIFDLAGPPGDTLDAVLVKEGDWVDAGTPLARLRSAKENTDRLRQAEAELAAARKQATADVAVARQLLTAAEEEATIAGSRLKRIQAARDSEFISPDTIEARTLANSTAQAKLAQARQDVAKAERQGQKSVQAAEAELKLAQTTLTAAEVRAPIRARVLKVLGRPGQPTGRQELFKLGDTTVMHVIAEVYESDILKIKQGQRANITSIAFANKPMTGVVENVSGLVFRNTLQSMDPSAQVFARVVEVVIRMDAVEPLDRLVYLQVDVKIAL
jgi:HlyD family secretion protein